MDFNHESKQYYGPPRIPEGIRFHLGSEGESEKEVSLERPSGRITITRFHEKDPISHVESSATTKTLLLISDGEGYVSRDSPGEKSILNHAPGMFYIPRMSRVSLDGKFNGWVVTLEQSNPTSLEDVLQKDAPVFSRIYTPEELAQGKYIAGSPDRKGYFANWGLGQWNSTSPLNVAFALGGIGSTADSPQREPGVVEINLVDSGRLIATQTNPDIAEEAYSFPVRKGDVWIVGSDVYAKRTRLSNYRGFVIKWAEKPDTLINPKNKITLTDPEISSRFQSK